MYVLLLFCITNLSQQEQLVLSDRPFTSSRGGSSVGKGSVEFVACDVIIMAPTTRWLLSAQPALPVLSTSWWSVNTRSALSASAHKGCQGIMNGIRCGLEGCDRSASDRTPSWRKKTWTDEGFEQPKIAARQHIILKWQAGWENNNTTGQWTKSLLPHIEGWQSCKHKNLNYYLTQFFTGYRCFGDYLKKMKSVQVILVYTVRGRIRLRIQLFSASYGNASG